MGLLRAVHVLGAVLLVGNVIVSGVWATLAMRPAAAVPPRTVARFVVVTDWCFTVPGGALLLGSGLAMVRHAGWPLWGTPFVRVGLLALLVSLVAWLLVLVPLQSRWVRAPTEAEAYRLFRWWSVVGWAATVPLVIGLWVMATHR
jgi:uncharacterized membrane protein